MAMICSGGPSWRAVVGLQRNALRSVENSKSALWRRRICSSPVKPETLNPEMPRTDAFCSLAVSTKPQDRQLGVPLFCLAADAFRVNGSPTNIHAWRRLVPWDPRVWVIEVRSSPKASCFLTWAVHVRTSRCQVEISNSDPTVFFSFKSTHHIISLHSRLAYARIRAETPTPGECTTLGIYLWCIGRRLLGESPLPPNSPFNEY